MAVVRRPKKPEALPDWLYSLLGEDLGVEPGPLAAGKVAGKGLFAALRNAAERIRAKPPDWRQPVPNEQVARIRRKKHFARERKELAESAARRGDYPAANKYQRAAERAEKEAQEYIDDLAPGKWEEAQSKLARAHSLGEEIPGFTPAAQDRYEEAVEQAALSGKMKGAPPPKDYPARNRRMEVISGPLPDYVQELFRGTGRLEDIAKVKRAAKTGKPFKFDKYTFTSEDPAIAALFALRRGGMPMGKGGPKGPESRPLRSYLERVIHGPDAHNQSMFMRIRPKKGTKAYMKNWDETEWVFDPDRKYVVERLERDYPVMATQRYTDPADFLDDPADALLDKVGQLSPQLPKPSKWAENFDYVAWLRMLGVLPPAAVGAAALAEDR